jgi:protein phosphatase 1 regulatory subunit 11
LANEGSSEPVIAGTLNLRGSNNVQNRKVKWDKNVVDNEGANKKKSKRKFIHNSYMTICNKHQHVPLHFIVCCIYHRPREFGESSDDSDSSTDSESDHDHHHDDDKQHHSHDSHQNKGKPNSRLGTRPNAYERQPQYKGEYKSSFT